ncbi:MAG: pentapeptide repeat-containing protein, partial [Ramlibacter sp.]
MRKLYSFVLAANLLLATAISGAADLTSEQVRATLAQASAEKPADLARKDLSNLDLSGLDFKGANLAGANLFGAKLVGADLRKVDL